jgi:hypothetical protein
LSLSSNNSIADLIIAMTQGDIALAAKRATRDIPSYGTSVNAMFRRAVAFVDGILKGARRRLPYLDPPPGPVSFANGHPDKTEMGIEPDAPSSPSGPTDDQAALLVLPTAPVVRRG